MSKEGIEGATQKHIGEAKEGIGKAIGDNKLVGDGVKDRAIGGAKETFGKAKDAVHKATD